MRAYLSSLPQPMSPERSSLYARTLGETSSWPDVAIVEAREIISQTEPDSPGTALFSIERLQGAGRLDGQGRVYGFPGTYALAESLAHFLTLDLQ